MATKEHLSLSSYLKHIHGKLRQNASILGAETAWKEHCQDKEALRKYATTMKELALNHWDTNSAQEDSKAISRVEWAVSQSTEYFIQDSIQKYREKELAISQKIDFKLESIPLKLWEMTEIRKLQLLDVGSCYNPFKHFDIFTVTAIDIAPACDDVIECDFLNINVSDEQSSKTDSGSAKNLQANFFDIIVFSLFLEYLPTPRQRLKCCENAYQLLKTEGILIVITPDSKHVGANAKIMKSWKFLLALMGFFRIVYEKLPHIHCMVFRKCLNKEISHRWAHLQSKDHFYEEMFIPQDLNKKEHVTNELDDCVETRKENVIDRNVLFEELPFST